MGETINRILLGLLMAAIGGVTYADGCGCGSQPVLKSHGLFSCQPKCQKCCPQTETIVIHCGSGGPVSNSRNESGDRDRLVAAPTLVNPQYNLGVAPQPMMQMPMMMPYYGGIMQAGTFGARNESADRSRSCDEERVDKRLDQLEEDFRKLTRQLDEIVVSVDRNAVALERLVDKLIKKEILVDESAQ